MRGIRVDEHTALAHSAVWRSINVIANALMTIPWTLYEEKDDHRRRIREGRIADMHRGLVNPEMHNSTFRQTLGAHVVSRGNGYAEIERFRGEPVNLWPLNPENVSPARTATGELIYDVRQDRGPNVVLPALNVFHWKGLGYDGLVGYSPLTLARKAIALGLATEQHGIALFSNDATPGGIITVPESIIFDQVNEDAFLEQWDKRHGNPANKGKPAVLRDGMTWESVSISPEDAQFLQTRQFQISDIGPRWFGVPAPLVGDNDKATLNNFEQMMTMFVVHGLTPPARAFETEVDWKLLDFREGQYSKLNLNGLMRGDMAARADFYTKMLRSAGMTPDTVARLEDEDPMDEGGDQRYISRDLMPLSIAATGIIADQAAAFPGQTKEMGADMFDGLWADAIGRILRKEESALKRAAAKHAGNPSAWGVWLEKFLAPHSEFIKGTLQSVIGVELRAGGIDPYEQHVQIALAGIGPQWCAAFRTEWGAAMDSDTSGKLATIENIELQAADKIKWIRDVVSRLAPRAA